jgi:hypothetical protein
MSAVSSTFSISSTTDWSSSLRPANSSPSRPMNPEVRVRASPGASAVLIVLLFILYLGFSRRLGRAAWQSGGRCVDRIDLPLAGRAGPAHEEDAEGPGHAHASHHRYQLIELGGADRQRREIHRGWDTITKRGIVAA